MDSEKTNGRPVKEADLPPFAYRSRPPQSESRPRRWWIWLLGVGLVILISYVLFFRLHLGAKALVHLGIGQAPAANAAASAASRSIPVVAVPALKGDMNVFLTGLGTVTPLNTVLLHTRVDGQVDQVAFTEGQMVKTGDLLVQIDPRPFQVQLEQAEGQLEKDQAALQDAKLDLQRFQYLLTQKSVTQQQVDTQQATVHQDEGAVKSDQAQIDTANLQLTYAHITSPITGRIGLRLVDPGNIVHATDTAGLAVITQVQPITIIFTLPEDDIPTIQKAMKGGHPLEVDAYNRDLTMKLAKGSLLTIDNQIDPTTGNVKLRASFPNEELELFPNQFVNARLLVETLEGAIIVPTAAVQLSPASTFVYAVKADGTVEMRNVVVRQLKANEFLAELGKAQGDESVVESGLQPGDVVVTDGVDKLQNGSKVTIRTTAEGGNPTTAPAGGPTSRPHHSHAAAAAGKEGE